ncbi:MAG: divergent polysaccharide deacetylase family protein [Deltaproteobacteria bacterium]|nr:divergent polysaccharide deacetylase family protein [Deltaproteobacteria bacterium]
MGNNKKNKGHLKKSNALIIFGVVIGILAAVIFFKYYHAEEKIKKVEEIKEAETIPSISKIEEKPLEIEASKPLPEVIEKIKPKIAIVIDDMGQDIKQLRELLGVDIPITIAILPFLPHSKDVAEEADKNNMEILLHIPMEPKDIKNNNPGKGAILSTMPEDKIYDTLLKDIEAVPHIKGVNNHMGSKLTEDEARIRIVLKAVKQKNLFFLDSKTTAKSLAYKIAKEIGLNAAQRQIFLDNEQDVSYIKNQITELIKMAKKNGSAIAIGHPHPSTFAAIKEMASELKSEEIEVVSVSQLTALQ